MRAPKRMYLVPAPGRRVRVYHDPIRFRQRPPRCYLAEAGEWVPPMAEYIRAVRCGDAVEGTPPKISSGSSKKKGD